MRRKTAVIVLCWTRGALFDSAKVSSTLSIRAKRLCSLSVSNGVHPEMTLRARSK